MLKISSLISLLEVLLKAYMLQTREELRVALEKELREFSEGREVRNNSMTVCWNHAEFEVKNHLEPFVYFILFYEGFYFFKKINIKTLQN